MGCDAYADENGEYELSISDYDTGYVYARVSFKTEPRAKIIEDRIKGDAR